MNCLNNCGKEALADRKYCEICGNRKNSKGGATKRLYFDEDGNRIKCSRKNCKERATNRGLCQNHYNHTRRVSNGKYRLHGFVLTKRDWMFLPLEFNSHQLGERYNEQVDSICTRYSNGKIKKKGHD